MPILHWMLKGIDISGKYKESTHLRTRSSLYFYGLTSNLVAMADMLMNHSTKTCIFILHLDATGFFHFLKAVVRSGIKNVLYNTAQNSGLEQMYFKEYS